MLEMICIIFGIIIIVVLFSIHIYSNNKYQDLLKKIISKEDIKTIINDRCKSFIDIINDKMYKLENNADNRDKIIDDLKLQIKKQIILNTEKKVIKCLIIDDDPNILAFTAMFLKMLPERKEWKNYKFLTICANSCEEGIQLLSMHQFNLAIVDYKLPKKSGFCFWYHCKENKKILDKKGDLNIIIYSSSTEHALENIPRDIAPYFLECKRSISNVIEKSGDMKKWDELTDKLKEMI